MGPCTTAQCAPHSTHVTNTAGGHAPLARSIRSPATSDAMPRPNVVLEERDMVCLDKDSGQAAARGGRTAQQVQKHNIASMRAAAAAPAV